MKDLLRFWSKFSDFMRKGIFRRLPHFSPSSLRTWSPAEMKCYRVWKDSSSIGALESRIHTVWAKTTGHWAHLASTNSCPKAVLPGDQGLDWFFTNVKKHFRTKSQGDHFLPFPDILSVFVSTEGKMFKSLFANSAAITQIQIPSKSKV